MPDKNKHAPSKSGGVDTHYEKGGQPHLDLEIPHGNLGELVEVEGVLVPDNLGPHSGARGRGAEGRIAELATGRRNGAVGSREVRRKSVRKLSKKWKRLAEGFSEPTIRSSFMGGVVAEWGGGEMVSIEFSRRLKKVWVDSSSPHGDWGMEVKLGRGGWRKLRKKLTKMLPL